MTVERISDASALVVVDLQAGTLANPFMRPAAEIVAAAVELIAAFRAAGRPIVFAVSTGSPRGQTEYGAGRTWPDGFDTLAPELDRRAGEPLLSRAAWSAFADTGLDAILRDAGVTEVVIAGVATTFGIESTARDAYDLGLDVVLVADAMSDMSEEAHAQAVQGRFPALARLATTVEIVGLLVQE